MLCLQPASHEGTRPDGSRQKHERRSKRIRETRGHVRWSVRSGGGRQQVEESRCMPPTPGAVAEADTLLLPAAFPGRNALPIPPRLIVHRVDCDSPLFVRRCGAQS